jgi:hypothetical protein
LGVPAERSRTLKKRAIQNYVQEWEEKTTTGGPRRENLASRSVAFLLDKQSTHK